MIKQLSWRMAQALFVVLAVGLLTWLLVQAPGNQRAAKVKLQQIEEPVQQRTAAAKRSIQLLLYTSACARCTGGAMIKQLSWRMAQALFVVLAVGLLKLQQIEEPVQQRTAAAKRSIQLLLYPRHRFGIDASV
jgi:predicted MFS family arabinose efflux permease